MNQKSSCRITTGLLFCALLLTYCTKSPFDEKVTPPATKIAGKVDLHRLDGDNGDVYVWLEEINIGTYTDSSGRFELEMPRERSLDVTGSFRLFCYVANYTLATAEIIVQDGLFKYGQGDLNRLGNLNRIIDLFKIVDVSTIVEPRWAASNDSDAIDVLVTLKAINNPVTVIFPKSVGGLLGGLFFRNVDTEQIFIDNPDPGADDTREFVNVEPEQSVSRRGVFQLNGSNFRNLFLPVGDYEVIPFIFIYHENLPQELLDSLGERVEDLNPQFLKIPVKRDGGKFRIIG